MTLDCGALPETLIESELFGHEKGAFTGANARKLGRIESADRGTLFLDEIGELPAPVQTRLLRVLETREVQRLGGSRARRVDVRFIAATNADLEARVRDGRFRADLYHRLHVFPIRIPPLRERGEDIAELARYFVRELARQHRKTLRPIAPDLIASLCRYRWPGNVRELRNVLERAVILADDHIGREHLRGLDETAGDDAPPAGARSFAAVSLKEVKDRAAQLAARRAIEATMAETGGDKKQAARLLGVSLKTLYNHLEALALGAGRDR